MLGGAGLQPPQTGWRCQCSPACKTGCTALCLCPCKRVSRQQRVCRRGAEAPCKAAAPATPPATPTAALTLGSDARCQHQAERRSAQPSTPHGSWCRRGSWAEVGGLCTGGSGGESWWAGRAAALPPAAKAAACSAQPGCAEAARSLHSSAALGGAGEEPNLHASARDMSLLGPLSRNPPLAVYWQLQRMLGRREGRAGLP